jgi:hypothetical protein
MISVSEFRKYVEEFKITHFKRVISNMTVSEYEAYTTAFENATKVAVAYMNVFNNEEVENEKNIN